MPYFNDDGTEFNPDLMPRPGLCSTCKKDNRSDQEIKCNLTRNDQQGEKRFICFAYEPDSQNIDGKAVLKEMQDYLDKKYEER